MRQQEPGGIRQAVEHLADCPYANGNRSGFVVDGKPELRPPVRRREPDARTVGV